MRSAVVGIGQALRGDDEASCAVARGLLARGQTPEAGLILEAGAAPENVTGLLRRHRPRLVVLVDAAEMQAVNGLAAVLSVAAPQTAAADDASCVKKVDDGGSQGRHSAHRIEAQPSHL